MALSLFVSVWFQVLFHSPYRGSFHLSLAVLVHYRLVGSIQPWRVVSPDSDRISRVPSYSGFLPKIFIVQIRGLHPLWPSFPTSSPIQIFYYAGPTTPQFQELWFGPICFRSPLLAESHQISFPVGTQMFQFPTFAPRWLLYSPTGHYDFSQRGCPIRISAGQCLFSGSPQLFAA